MVHTLERVINLCLPAVAGFFKNHRLAIPSNREYSVPQLKMMLNEIEKIVDKKISANDWNTL